MAEKLRGSNLQDKIIPTWSVGCRRITPGVGYLEALVHEKTHVVTHGVKEITPTGCISEDGKEYPVNVIICATGFNASFLPRFPIIGFNGVSMEDAWKDEPSSYLGFAAAEFPNYFIVIGPNSPVGNGPLLICMGKQTSFPCLSSLLLSHVEPKLPEAQMDYFLKLINRYQTENIHSISPKKEAIEDFVEHKDKYMKRTVWESDCRSWYKNGSITGKVTALWPGSSLHYLEALLQPRYEDWNFTYIGNRFSYLGNGFSQTEVDRTADWSYYLQIEDDSPLIGRAKERRVYSRSGTISRPEALGKL